MTIQNMFNMAKGQTLTQDGCEADVDDKRYNIGDISQKTGLQKTANGWVKPRSGKAPGAKTGPGESPKGRSKEDVKKEVIKEMSPEHIAAVMNGRTYRNVKEGRGVIDITKADLIALGKNAEWKPDESAHLSHKDHVSLAKEVKSNSLPGSDWTAEEIAKEWKLGKGDAEEVKKEFDKIKTGSKPAESKPDKVGDFMKAYERGDFGKFQQNAEQRKVASFFNSANDCAPRVLTKDTKIRVRKA